MKRFLRRALLGILGLWLIITAASLGYNAFTNRTADPPPGLKYVQAGDIKTRYDTWGTTGTPVVLVHGAAESVDTWSRLVPLLATNHRVYAYDITGYGHSERKAPYTVEHLAGQLLGFLDAMHLGGPGQPRPILSAIRWVPVSPPRPRWRLRLASAESCSSTATVCRYPVVAVPACGEWSSRRTGRLCCAWSWARTR